MRKLIHPVLVAGCLLWAGPLRAQQPCPSFSVVVNTPEDELMLAVNGAENPQEQIDALDKFSKEHADSKFIPCVNEYYTIAYIKLNNYDKAIEYGEKDLALNYRDLNLILNLVRAYMASQKVTDAAFDVILKAPEQIKAESVPSRPAGVSDADWEKSLKEVQEQVAGWRATAEYTFFQLLMRVPDGAKRAQLLDSFTQAYPDSKNVAQINFHYFLAYKMANNGPKAMEYGEKAVAADPTNVATLNLVADDSAIRQTNLDKASEYAKKALELAPGMKKPEGMNDEQFKAYQASELGLAHATLGYIAFQKASKTRRVDPAIQEFNSAVPLLGSSPELQARTLYFLGYAYEARSPVNHKGAIDALTRAASLQSSWQAQAQDLLAKVKREVGK